MQSYLNAILAITEDAAKIPRSFFRKPLSIENKEDASPVTIADQRTEEFIRSELARQFPDHSILGEEFGQSTKDSDWHWIIDPIDGTRSFISGMPLYGMLIALLHKGTPVLGVVRMPELSEVYTGTSAGAFVNLTAALKVSETTVLEHAFLYVNEGEKLLAEQPETLRKLCASGRDRRFGYDCYPHMLMASGHIDACVDYDLKPYDFLPLVPIIQAAGGVVTDWAGQPLGLHSDGRVASAATTALHGALLELLN